MSTLTDCQRKISALLGEIIAKRDAYEVAMAAYLKLENGEPVNLSEIGMSIYFGATVIPLPLPTDRQVVSEHCAVGINTLAGELARLWYELSDTAIVAVQHVRSAQEQAELTASPPVTAVTPHIEPWPVQPPTQLQPPQQPPVNPPNRTGRLPDSVTLPGPGSAVRTTAVNG